MANFSHNINIYYWVVKSNTWFDSDRIMYPRDVFKICKILLHSQYLSTFCYKSISFNQKVWECNISAPTNYTFFEPGVWALVFANNIDFDNLADYIVWRSHLDSVRLLITKWYFHIYIYIYLQLYIYIEREREREIDR